MKYKILFLLLFLNSSSLLAKESVKEIFSMNLHCAIEEWEFRVNTILDEVVKINPDIISFQEVCVNKKLNMISFIKNGLMNRGYHSKKVESFFTHKAWDKYDEYILMFSKLDVQKSIKEFLPKSPIIRGYIALKIQGTWYLNVHLEHRRDYAKYRKEQIHYLINKFSSSPHFIMGDFNSSPWDEEQTELHENKYQFYFPGLTHPQPNPTRAIDGFWISNQVMGIKFEAARLFEEAVNGIFLSDHLAVKLKVLD